MKETTGGRGPDACIDAKQAMILETDRPIALREAILACRNGGVVSIAGSL